VLKVPLNPNQSLSQSINQSIHQLESLVITVYDVLYVTPTFAIQTAVLQMWNFFSDDQAFQLTLIILVPSIVVFLRMFILCSRTNYLQLILSFLL